MSKTLVIAEKPSVAQDLVRALTPDVGQFTKHENYFENERYIITSAVGHLLEIQVPEEYQVKRGKWSFAHLPVIPPHFDIKPVEKTKTRLNAVVKLAKRKDVTELINACDAGREGELIFRLIEQYAGGKKPLAKPTRRLWLNSMTQQAIRDGFANLRSNEQMQGLHDAARSRSEADWLVGINGTRAMTAFNSREGGFFLTTVGRVQTPTLAIVVSREEQIRAFQARNYFEVHATFLAQAGEYKGKWFDPNWKKTEDAEMKADRLWDQAKAQAIVDAVRNKAASVSEQSKPSKQASPLLFDLTSLQREANGKFGFSAKTTLSIAQSLYEKHKVITYPRTDSRYLPQDYLGVSHKAFAMLAGSGMLHLAPHAQKAIDNEYIKPSRRIFDNSKVSDHFAIIPTLQAPKKLSEVEQKIYDLIARRFMAVFYPSAEYLVTTRISEVLGNHFKTEGKVLVEAGWLAIYGKEVNPEQGNNSAQQSVKDKNLVEVTKGEMVRTESARVESLQTKPPARYSEATLLSAMEGAGKTIEDEELRAAMHEKGLGTPATRASIIEGLISEKYLLRDGRELSPSAKAFQLMTLLRGLQVEELCTPELTGEWEARLAQIEHGKLSRDEFMRGIIDLTKHMVQKAKEFDRETIPGNYATLETPCPQCGGIVKENYRRYTCTGKDDNEQGCGFSISKTPGGRTFDLAEVEQLLRDKHIGPLDGFRSKAGWLFTAELKIVFDDETKNYKLEFDFGNKEESENDEIPDLSQAQSLGACPICSSKVVDIGTKYVCEKAVKTVAQNKPSCSFKMGGIILQQPIDHTQIAKLLQYGKTDLLDKFISNRTRRPFKAFLVWDEKAQKVGFEFEPRKGSTNKRKTKTTSAAASKTTKTKKAPKTKAPRSGNLKPSPELAAIIGNGPFGRGEVTKKLWEYIKAHNLQDPKDKRTIVADDKLRPILGADRLGMFKLAGVIGKHLS